jgi:acyl-CoA thioester hydrolase
VALGYTLQLRVHFNETDAMGVAHHSSYVNYVERARVEFLRSRGLSYREVTDSGVHLAVVEIHFKYLRSAYFDDVLMVRVNLSHLGRASAVFQFEIQRDECTVCHGFTKLACVNRDAKVLPLPDKVRRLMEEDVST